MTLNPALVGEAIRAACITELRALKPGNVHRYAPGHGMTVADFEASAEAIADIFTQPRLAVGERILRSIEETQHSVGSNTNLGIVLLAAPLAQAALLDAPGRLRLRLGRVLAELDMADAELAFRAIRLADPAGLGECERHDVRAPARVTLREAMAEAADRDTIARQYVTDYRDIFELGLDWLQEAASRWHDEAWAAARVFLGFLAQIPDSHVARKYGAEQAEALCRRAEPLAKGLAEAKDPRSMEAALLEFDAVLKTEGLNPGTSADLTVASLFAQKLEELIAESA
ncbi:MAG: triphosphoribosyl-dephospho-CoA synthase [Rhodospirillales bacterium]|nr:triphosphoribosyl-dephospho-CoA synthase [Rhodospirillales bacterium]